MKFCTSCHVVSDSRRTSVVVVVVVVVVVDVSSGSCDKQTAEDSVQRKLLHTETRLYVWTSPLTETAEDATGLTPQNVAPRSHVPGRQTVFVGRT